jgi:hypothetical protein
VGAAFDLTMTGSHELPPLQLHKSNTSSSSSNFYAVSMQCLCSTAFMFFEAPQKHQYSCCLLKAL